MASINVEKLSLRVLIALEAKLKSEIATPAIDSWELVTNA